MFSLILKCDAMTLNLRPLECFLSRDQYLCKIRLLKQQQQQQIFTCRKSSTPTAFVWNTNMAAARHVKPLSSAEAPARYPYENSNNRKNRKRAGSDGKREKARSVFLSPQPPHNTKMPLRRREM